MKDDNTSNEIYFLEFLQDHYYEIKGLYNDCYYKNGGWNGLIDAILIIWKKNENDINFIDELGEEFEEIIDKVFS